MENEKLIKEALESWRKGLLTEISTLFVVYNLVFPQKVSKEAIDWAKKKIADIENNATIV